MDLCGNMCHVRPAGGEALDRLDRRVRRRAVCVRSPRPHVARSATPSATPSTRLQRVAAHCDTPHCRCIDKLGVGPILPLLHEIDAVAKLQRLDISVLVQCHAPIDGSRALTRLSLTCKHAHARCLCALPRVGKTPSCGARGNCMRAIELHNLNNLFLGGHLARGNYILIL